MADYDIEIAPKKHILKVLTNNYNDCNGFYNYSECLVIEPVGLINRTIRVDLFCCGSLSEGIDYDDLIGKTISVEYTHGYIFLAEGVSICS